MAISLCLMIGLSLMAPAQRALAQQASIQQPAVSVFGTATTISVPDRGAVNIGGMKSTASTSAVFGPIPAGISSGFQTSAASSEARVWIHDPAAADAALLQQAESRFHHLSAGERTDLARRILRTRSAAIGNGSSSRQFPMAGSSALQILRDKR
jgi:hypothetical protein